jgi:hypothetical protein
MVLSTREDTFNARELSNPGLRAFFKLAECWQLTTKEQMGLLGLGERRSTLFHWKKHGGVLSPDTLERISYLLGIYKALRILLPTQEAAHAWVKKPNQAPLFGGRPALERMVRGMSDLFVVRQYLDAQRGGWA